MSKSDCFEKDNATPSAAVEKNAAIEAERKKTSSDLQSGSIDSGLGVDAVSSSNAGCTQLIEDSAIFVSFGAEKFSLTVSLDDSVENFRTKIAKLSSVPSNLQKLICKGVKLVDGKSLRECKVEANSKIMLIGSKLNDVANVNEKPKTSDFKDDDIIEAEKKEPLCRQKQHLKILEKGLPDDALPGIKNERDPLPEFPISGMVNKHGGKVRLTFKLESDQVWIGTKERTEKIPMSQIKTVISEPIEFHEEYHIMALQLGPTEQSRYFLYWVPAQFVSAIKEAIMGS